MNLVPITNRKEITKVFDSLRSCLIADSKAFSRKVKWHGDYLSLNLHWHEENGLWVGFGLEGHTRFWCSYGTMNPAENHSLDISCEINVQTEGISRTCGILLKDEGAGRYLAHSGEFGGARKAIEKAAFLDTYDGLTVQLQWPDGCAGKVAILGKLDDESFLANIASYIKAVDAFNAAEKGRTPNVKAHQSAKQKEAQDA